jgi:CheY-like chemotaxis protein
MEEKKKKVLIVDDDPFLLGMYSLKFQNSGFEVESSTNARDALEKLKSDVHYDAVIFDIVMPAMDGFQFMEEVNKNNLLEKSCFIALTNQSQPSDIEKGKKLGAAGYIIKASTIPSEVVKEVEAILNNRKN